MISKTPQIVDIPIANLYLEGNAIKIGYVTFMTITEKELAKWKNKPLLWQPTQYDIHVFARVETPGDSKEETFSYAKSQVDQVLNILRALCFPFGRRSETMQIGMIGNMTQTTAIPMRMNNREFAAQFSTPSGLHPALIELRKSIWSKVEQSQWESISKIMVKNEQSKMESKLLTGLQWVGESTKPDTNNAKFTKICFALETMIGGEPKYEDLKVRGITAMLAERAAFLIGEDLNNRLDIDHKIRKYYGKRSEIVHEGQANISLADLDDFGALVRRIALALLEKLDKERDKLNTVEKLEGWVRSQRYTLLDECNRGGTECQKRS